VIAVAPARALALVVSLATVRCAGPTPVIPPGPWGGSHVRMDVTSAGARLEYDCAEGVIEEPLRPDAEGRFTATGVHTPGHGGPIRVGEILPAFRARYEGRVDGEQMILLVTLTETGVELGSFQLRRGNSGLLMRCL
jgi:hypothetical protein